MGTVMCIDEYSVGYNDEYKATQMTITMSSVTSTVMSNVVIQ
jgi:hypothetical protein